MASPYPVPSGRVRVEYRQSNSLFIATLERASTVEEARAILRAIRREMPDATHHVHAMKIGFGASVIEGASDDGEPPGTSGPPALAILRGAPLGDAMLVISRYFGGTKLGTGGLVQAYSAAARAAIDTVPTELKVERQPLLIATPYTHYEKARQLVEEGQGIIEGEDFTDSVELRVRYPVEAVGELLRGLRDLSAGVIRVERLESGEDGPSGG